MNGTNDSVENRVVFFDNLRYFCVLCVVLQHASMAYANITWWPVVDDKASAIARVLLFFFDAFAMPLLFYIAGYFAIPKIQEKGIGSFLTGKLKRLGIPWFVCIVTVMPVYFLINQYTRNNFTLSSSYWDLWVWFMKKFAEFNIGIIDSSSFNQGYTWFLSLLLAFFLIFGAMYKIKKSWFITDNRPDTPLKTSIFSTLKFIMVVGFLTFILSVMLVQIMLIASSATTFPESWLTLGNILQFQPSRLFLYIIYFIMGIIIYKKRWIERGRFSGHFNTWLISFSIFLVGYYYFYYVLFHHANTDSQTKMYGALFFFIRNFLTVSILGLLTTLGIRFWNRPSIINKNLASNSYDIYLGHFIFVMVFQLIMFYIPGIPGLVKYGIVSLLSIISVYLVSQFLMRPFPRVAAAVAFVMLIVMFVFIRP